MTIKRLQISNLRNLQSLSLTPGPHLNVLFGDNGAGKTSILEAIHLLGSQRSFRTTNHLPVISQRADSYHLFSEASEHRVGISRDRQGKVELKIDGVSHNKASELAEILPVQVFHAGSFDVVDGSPLHRRQLLDWGVFHVEHQFIQDWRNFSTTLKQRNKLLRGGTIDRDQLCVWDREFCRYASLIDVHRKRYLAQLTPYIFEIMDEFGVDSAGWQIAYRAGWPKDKELAEVLAQNWESDLGRGYTQSGPQRADLVLSTEAGSAKDVLSRGQKKLLVLSIILAQVSVLKELTNKVSVLLLDDLPSELDHRHLQQVLRRTTKLGNQVFITTVAKPTFILPEKSKVFHVEQGAAKEVVVEFEGNH